MIKYAKLEAGELTPAPNPATIDGRTVSNPTAEMYASIGYLPVRYTDPPELPEKATEYPVAHWEDTGTEIIMVWDLQPITPPEPVKPTMEERMLVQEIQSQTDGQNISDLQIKADAVDAQATYTAMMTDTLMEV